jgi:hypothetical protein
VVASQSQKLSCAHVSSYLRRVGTDTSIRTGQPAAKAD